MCIIDDNETKPFRGELASAALRSGDADGWQGILRRHLREPDSALPVAPATDRTVWAGPASVLDPATLQSIGVAAERESATPWPAPLASDAARVHRDGDRENWEKPAFARQQRLSRAAVMAASTLDAAWLDRTVDGIIALCEQSSWCWPAHDDTFRAHGSVLATVTDPFVDLGAGEVVAQLAWVDQLLGAVLDARWPGLRTRIRHEAAVRVFEPFVRRRDWHWIGLDGDVHNWNPWIHGNIIIAALRLLDGDDDQERRIEVIALALEGLDRYVTSLPADGAIDEGYSYWWNGAYRALEALDVLGYATGGELAVVPGIRALVETVAFPHRMSLGNGWYLNLADGQARPRDLVPWHALHRAAIAVGDEEARLHAALHRVAGAPAASEGEGLGRLLRGMTDSDWLAASAPAASASSDSPRVPRDVWLPSTEVMIAREHAGSTRGLTLALKGGHNGEHHNHNDVGSFIVASDGVPVVVDAGRPTYTAATFGPDRYEIFTMQSSWHNLPEIRGVAQGAGAEFRATDVEYAATDVAAELSLELRLAYPVPGLRSWRRSARLERGADRARVRIDDRWLLESDSTTSGPTTVRLLLAGSVELQRGSLVVSPLGLARAVRIVWHPEVDATVQVRELDDRQLTEVWGARLTRVDLPVDDLREFTVSVEQIKPAGIGPSSTERTRVESSSTEPSSTEPSSKDMR